VDLVQMAVWIMLGVALVPFARTAASVLSDRESRSRVPLIGGLALGARLLVPLLPFNWYSGVSNVDLGGPIYSKDTTYMPLPSQWITFTLGFYGILIFNILTNTMSAILAWHVTRRAGYGERTALFFGIAVALTPMYVRLSSSDSTHILALPLWWVAAVAMQRLIDGRGGRVDQLVLFASAVVTCPIRVEAGLSMPSIVLLLARDLPGLRVVWEARRRWSPFIFGWLLGMACSLSVQSASWNLRLRQFDAIIFVVQFLARILFLVSFDPLGWIPVIYVLLIWYYIYHAVRRHDLAEVAATVLPFVLFSIPYAYSATAITLELPATAYGVSLNMFLLLAAAKGAALLYERLGDGWLRGWSSWRVPAAVVATTILLGSLLVPYRWTYAYMEEFAFLFHSLPRHKARILAIWDPACPGGDFDCCLALPYPTFVGDFPELEWQILGQRDADEVQLRNLQFDYYYPGSLVAVDVANLNSWFIGRLFPDPEMNARQQAPLRRLQSMDEFIRANYPLSIYRQATVPAHTFSWAPFRDDRMTLTLYRADGAASAR
jgi:hypothetical protein